MNPSVSVVIPVYKPGKVFYDVLDAIKNQTLGVSRIVLMDSSPSHKCDIDADHPFIVVPVNNFDHGLTRFEGAKIAQSDYVVFLTQDAVMESRCLEKLYDFISINDLAAAFARQVPRRGAGVLESFDRRFNYPDASEIRRSAPSTIKDVFFSDVCSMVNFEALCSVGGMPHPILTNEDVVLAAKLLRSSFGIGYCADARVVHSHPPGFWTSLRRFFDTGAMHAQWSDDIPLNTIGSKGSSYVFSAFRHVCSSRPIELPVMLGHLAGKVLGYSLGKYYRIIPGFIRPYLSGNRAYWVAQKNI